MSLWPPFSSFSLFLKFFILNVNFILLLLMFHCIYLLIVQSMFLKATKMYTKVKICLEIERKGYIINKLYIYLSCTSVGLITLESLQINSCITAWNCLFTLGIKSPRGVTCLMREKRISV